MDPAHKEIFPVHDKLNVAEKKLAKAYNKINDYKNREQMLMRELASVTNKKDYLMSELGDWQSNRKVKDTYGVIQMANCGPIPDEVHFIEQLRDIDADKKALKEKIVDTLPSCIELVVSTFMRKKAHREIVDELEERIENLEYKLLVQAKEMKDIKKNGGLRPKTNGRVRKEKKKDA